MSTPVMSCVSLISSLDDGKNFLPMFEEMIQHPALEICQVRGDGDGDHY